MEADIQCGTSERGQHKYAPNAVEPPYSATSSAAIRSHFLLYESMKEEVSFGA